MSDQEAMVPSLRGPIERVVLVGEQGGVHEKSWESACRRLVARERLERMLK